MIMKKYFLLLALLIFVSAGAAEKYRQVKRMSEACWLWVRDPGKKDLEYNFSLDASQNCFLRMDIVLDEDVKNAVFYSFWDKSAKFYVNGKEINMSAMPQFSSLRGHVKAKGCDITKLLKPGKNVIAVAASTNARRSCYGVMIKGEIETVSGRKIPIISSAKNFKAASTVSAEWLSENFDDSHWLAALELGDARMSPWILSGDTITQFASEHEQKNWREFCNAGFPLDRLLSEPEIPEVKVVYNGILPGISINGKIHSANQWGSLVTASCPTTDEYIFKTGKTGLNIYMICLGEANLRHGNGKFQLQDLDDAVKRFLTVNPDAHFMLWFKGNVTAQWAKENPDELVGFAKKSNSKSWHDYGGNPDVPSLASEKFLDQLADELKEIAGFVDSKPWGRRVIGTVIGYGGSGDGTPFGGLCMPDNGKRMTEAFRIHLRKKYGSDEALRRAWQMPDVTIDNAEVPGQTDRWGSGSYLRNPAIGKDQRVIDYYECYHDKFADWMIGWNKRAKEAFPGRISGGYYGYMILAYTPESSTANFEKVLQSPYVDFLRATTLGYNLTDGLHRQLHSVFHRYGKFASIEGDLRTHAQRDTVIGRGEERWLCRTPEETRASTNKFIANSLIYGCAYHTVDFGSNRANWFFDCPETLEPIKRGNELWQEFWNKKLAPASDIAVIVDYKQILKQGHPDYLSNRFIEYGFLGNTMQLLHFSGFSCTWMAPEDFLASTHPYKTAVFLNTFEFSPEMRQKIKDKLKKDGISAIWYYAPGIITPEGFSAGSMSELTGIKLDYVSEPRLLCAAVVPQDKSVNSAVADPFKNTPSAWRCAKLKSDASLTFRNGVFKLSVSKLNNSPYCAAIQNFKMSSGKTFQGCKLSIDCKSTGHAQLFLLYHYKDAAGKKQLQIDKLAISPSAQFTNFSTLICPPEKTEYVSAEFRVSAPGVYEFKNVRLSDGSDFEFFRNSSFENGTKHWSIVKHNKKDAALVKVSSNANISTASGEKSLEITLAENLASFTSLYQKREISNTAALKNSQLILTWQSSAKADALVTFCTMKNGKKEYIHSIAELHPAANAQTAAFPLNVPDSAVSIAVELRMKEKGIYRFDDIRIEKINTEKFFSNGGFEMPLAGSWQIINHSRTQTHAVNAVLDETAPAAGKRALKIDVSEDLNIFACAYQKRSIPVAPILNGKHISIAFKGSQNADLVFDFTVLKDGKTEHVYSFGTVPASKEWVRTSFPLNVPEKAVSMAIELRIKRKGTYFFDDFAVNDGVLSIPGHEARAESPRVFSTDKDAVVMANYIDDGTPAMVSKSMSDGTLSIFCGIPVNRKDIWEKLLKDTGCHAYTPQGFYVKKNNRLLMIFAIGDGIVPPECEIMKFNVNRTATFPVTLKKKYPRIVDLLTGEIVGENTDHFTLTATRPRVWLFEIDE